MAASSVPPVSTLSDFLPITMAVPVSWHIGSTPPAATHALRSRSVATNRSLPEACGSSMIARSCARCDVRSRCEMSLTASRASIVSTSGSTRRKVRPAALIGSTALASSRRYSVSSGRNGSTSTWLNPFVTQCTLPFGSYWARHDVRLPLGRVLGGRMRRAGPNWAGPYGTTTMRRGLAGVGPQPFGAFPLTQLGHHLALDLPDALARQPETAADLVQGARLTVVEAVPHADDLLLAVLKGGQHPAQVVLQQAGDHGGLGVGRLGVLDEVAKRRLLLVADRHVQAHRVARVVEQVGDLLDGQPGALGQFLVGGLAAKQLVELTLEPGELVDLLDKVHGQPDGAALVGHAARDGLADPPRRVGGELEALGVVELLHGPNEPEVALLDEVEQRHAASGVALGQADHQPQIGLEQVPFGPLAVPYDGLQVGELDVGQARRGVQHVPGEHARLDAFGQLDLLLCGQQRGAADAVEIHTNQVCSGSLRIEIGFGRFFSVRQDLRRAQCCGHWLPPWIGARNAFAPTLGSTLFREDSFPPSGRRTWP